MGVWRVYWWLVAREVQVSGRGVATLGESNYLNAAFCCWCHAIKANSIRWIYWADCGALTLCIYNSVGRGRGGGDSIGLYFETADLRTAVARGRDSYYGWFCSNLWHCGHVTHIIQGFTLPPIPRRKWPNTGPPMKLTISTGLPQNSLIGDNGNPILLAPPPPRRLIDWVFVIHWKHTTPTLSFTVFSF